MIARSYIKINNLQMNIANQFINKYSQFQLFTKFKSILNYFILIKEKNKKKMKTNITLTMSNNYLVLFFK